MSILMVFKLATLNILFAYLTFFHFNFYIHFIYYYITILTPNLTRIRLILFVFFISISLKAYTSMVLEQRYWELLTAMSAVYQSLLAYFFNVKLVLLKFYILLAQLTLYFCVVSCIIYV